MTDDADITADPTNTAPVGAQTITPSAPPAPIVAATPRTFTQDEVNRIISDRISRDRQSRGNEPAPARQAEQRAPAPSSDADRIARLEQSIADQGFYRAAARAGTALDDDTERDLLDLYRVHKPENPGEWFAVRAARLGARTVTTPNTINQPAAFVPAAPPAPQGAASTTAPTIANPHATGALVDVSRMSAAELSALGPQGVAKAIAAVLESGRARDGRPQIPASAALKR